MSNSIPNDLSDFMSSELQLDNNVKNDITRLWRLYLRIYQHDPEQAEQELETFLQELYHMDNRTQERMLNATNQKITDIHREEGVTGLGLKKRKTGKKRRRSSRKTNKKRTNKKRKRRI
jgi:hypothetical protein